MTRKPGECDEESMTMEADAEISQGAVYDSGIKMETMEMHSDE